MLDKDGKRHCDRCGVKLTKRNNKFRLEICDKCNEYLEEFVESQPKKESEE